ncbi:MAG: ROK family protein, partial [Alistipes sp.]|nr:ROK family protein [Alistipes sp.]
STDITLTPKDIFEIAEGRRAGDVEAAKTAFAMLGEVAGDAMATAVTLIDGVIVIGGGLSAAAKYIKPALLKEMRSKIHTMQGGSLNRVQMAVYDLDNEAEFEAFAKGESRTIKVYGSEREVSYDPQKRIGITFSKIGANAATSVGAYAFALNQLDKK